MTTENQAAGPAEAAMSSDTRKCSIVNREDVCSGPADYDVVVYTGAPGNRGELYRAAGCLRHASAVAEKHAFAEIEEVPSSAVTPAPNTTDGPPALAAVMTLVDLFGRAAYDHGFGAPGASDDMTELFRQLPARLRELHAAGVVEGEHRAAIRRALPAKPIPTDEYGMPLDEVDPGEPADLSLVVATYYASRPEFEIAYLRSDQEAGQARGSWWPLSEPHCWTCNTMRTVTPVSWGEVCGWDGVDPGERPKVSTELIRDGAAPLRSWESLATALEEAFSPDSNDDALSLLAEVTAYVRNGMKSQEGP